MLTDAIRVTLAVTEVLEQLEIPYVIGGSLASAVYGVIRSTRDVDIVADLRPEHAASLTQALEATFYADQPMIEAAIQQRGQFNLLHLDTMFKVDIFVAKSRPFDQAQLDRSQRKPINDDPETRAYVLSPEDIILAKLEWYRLGGEISDRQWQDILGVLEVQTDALDYDYLREMAAQLGVEDLLLQALSD